MNKNLQNFALGALGAFIGALMCFAYFVGFSASSSKFTLRNNANGSFWFSFGPGLISSSNCASIDVCLGDRRNRVQVTDPTKIAKLKTWILDNKVDHQFNQSPIWPQNLAGRSIAPAYYLWLYDSPKVDFSNQFKSSIVFIPLDPLAMDITESEWTNKIDELRKIVTAD
jgi:hypothetical protein